MLQAHARQHPSYRPKPVPKRPYRLSSAGLERLRSSIQKSRPWEHATGPRTAQGKSRSSQNALKHGMRSARRIAEARKLTNALKEVEKVGRLQVSLLKASADGDRFWDLFEELLWLTSDDIGSGAMK